MYACCIRFYNTIVRLETLDKMKEDIIETLTKVLFNEKMSNLLIAICRVTTRDEERILLMKINEL